MDRILLNLSLAIDGVMMNRLRAILTALGIVFGVAAVIIMLAVGTGAQHAILEQLKLVGTNSIVLTSVVPDPENQEEESTESTDENKKQWSPGLTFADLDVIKKTLPTIEKISPEVIINTQLIANGRSGNVRCVGIENSFFELNNLHIGEGRPFATQHIEKGASVCIIGKRIQTRYFQGQDVIGKKIKCGHTWLTIIGVLENRIAIKENLENLGLRDNNSDVYIPFNTAMIRFNNRAKVEEGDINRNNRNRQYEENYHQIDRVVFQVEDLETLQASTDVIGRILKRRHKGIIDFEIQIPELLIMQQRKTQDTFNMVLVIIAAISLLVGGIGIMNIMLASVLERIKEIGIRRAVGASADDIVQQFLLEAVFISLIGGIIGVLLGMVCSRIISVSADIPTIISLWSIILSFGVAFIVGISFGLMPARKASRQNPIKALRTE